MSHKLSTRQVFVSVSAFMLVIGFFSVAWSGIIRTSISSHCTITASGDLKLRFDIRNKGNAMVHNMTATLTLSDVSRRYPDLGKNPPGGRMILEDEIDPPSWKPGVYAAMMTVFFEEQNGQTHLANHFFIIQYRMKSSQSGVAPLELRADSVVFNPNVFWNKEQPLQVTLKNIEDEAIVPELYLYLPEGFSSPETKGKHPLSPKGESVITLPVIKNKNAEPNKIFYLVASYDFKGLHYTSHLKEVIGIERKPVLFKMYVIVCGVALVIVWGFLMVVGREVTSDKKQVKV